MNRLRKFKTSQYLMLVVIVLVIIVPVARFYTVNPDVNACMIEYVDNLDTDNGGGFIYKINGVNHIEPENSIFNKYIFKDKIGYSQGCIMASGRLFTDFNNSVYCSLTYMTKVGMNHYSSMPDITLLERFELFKTREQALYFTLRTDLKIMEDMLFEYIRLGKGDVIYSVKLLDDKLLEGIKKLLLIINKL